jgi:hypothetical protein
VKGKEKDYLTKKFFVLLLFRFLGTKRLNIQSKISFSFFLFFFFFNVIFVLNFFILFFLREKLNGLKRNSARVLFRFCIFVISYSSFFFFLLLLLLSCRHIRIHYKTILPIRLLSKFLRINCFFQLHFFMVSVLTDAINKFDISIKVVL